MRVELKALRASTLLAALVLTAAIVSAQDSVPDYLQVRQVPHGTVQWWRISRRRSVKTGG